MMSTSALNLIVKNQLTEIARIAEAIETHGKAHEWHIQWITNINLSLDELVTNVISYGYDDDKAHEIHISLRERDDGALVVEIVDDGAPFDPFTEATEPNVHAVLEQRPIGGLGVYLVKSLIDHVHYERRDGHNRITLVQDSIQDTPELSP